ncbi:MAG: flagellar hook-length control protein FliK [Lachnospiraceae bacterium]|nr:flagellar hook-length control protein FliK [Lachnospiraceae bacterium]
MNLGNIFQPRNQNIGRADASIMTGSPSAGEKGHQTPVDIRNLVPGQTIQGEVVGRDGRTIQIALSPDNILSARLDRDISIALGQNMSFEVKMNTGSLLSLVPLYANMANEATISRALDAAGLPADANNMKMVSDMMQEGMSIDRDTIAYVNRQLVDFPNANPTSIIQMIRLGMPITEINIEQFEAYKNSEHQILKSAQEILEELPRTFSELITEGRGEDAVSFYEQIIKAFVGENAAQDIDGTVSLIPQEAEGADSAQEMLQKAVSGEIPEELQAQQKAEDVIPEGKTSENGPVSTQDAVTQGTAAQETAGEGKLPEGTIDKGGLLPENWQELGEKLQKLGADEKLADQIGNGKLSPKETLTQINNLLFGASGQVKEGLQDAIKDLFGSRAFQNLLQTEVRNQWTLQPEEVAQKEKIEQLYERIQEQTAKLNEAFQMVDKGDSAGAKSTQNLQNNLDFMNQMNQMFTYVQLPLMMAGNQAHGDLYVYTNKKSLARKDGNVTALLHLDMEHLGPVDVYVTMSQNQKVNTNFTLRDDEALDLVAKHIHILDERLAKRGYSMKANFQLKEEDASEETNIMQEILSQNKNISVLSRTSFDMRA